MTFIWMGVSPEISLDYPLLPEGNCGIPRYKKFIISPNNGLSRMLAAVIIGGCCGTTPQTLMVAYSPKGGRQINISSSEKLERIVFFKTKISKNAMPLIKKRFLIYWGVT